MSKVLKGIGKVAGPVASIAGMVTGNPILTAVGQGIGLANSAFGSSPKDIPQTGQFTGGVNFRGLTTPTFSLQEGANSTYNLTRTGGSGPSGLGLRSASIAQLQEILKKQQALAGRFDESRDTFGRLALGTQGPNARFQTSINEVLGDLNQLSAEATPGFGRLTESAVKTIRDRRADAVGNLRESLAKRRLQGASFADSAIAEADLSFAQEEERARAESIVQEIGVRKSIEETKASLFGALRDSDMDALMKSAQLFSAQVGLDQQQATLLTQQVATVKSELDAITQAITQDLQAFTADIQEFAVAGNIINRVQAIASNNAQFDLANQFAAAQAQGSAQGEFFNFLGGSGGKSIMSGFSSMFGETITPLPSNFSSSIGLFGRV